MLQKDTNVQLTQVRDDHPNDFNENLANAAGAVLLIKDYATGNTASSKTIAHPGFLSRRFTEGQMSLTMFVREILPTYFTFDEFRQGLWGVKKPFIVFAEEKVSTWFFYAMHLPPKMWNFSDQSLQFNFVLSHVPCFENPSVDCFSRLEITPTDRTQLSLSDSILISHNEGDLESQKSQQDVAEDHLRAEMIHSRGTVSTLHPNQEVVNALLTMVTQLYRLCIREWLRARLETRPRPNHLARWTRYIWRRPVCREKVTVLLQK